MTFFFNVSVNKVSFKLLPIYCSRDLIFSCSFMMSMCIYWKFCFLSGVMDVMVCEASSYYYV